MLKLLPKSLQDISELIGIEKTLKLVTHYGGKRIWIPRQPPQNWDLVRVLGSRDAYKLAALCGGSQVEIPSCQSLKLAARNEQIRSDRANSIRINELASKYRVSRRQIREICNAKNAV